MGKQKKPGMKAAQPSNQALYEASVQNVEADADFVDRVFLKERGRKPRLLREDFCGTASLAAHWAGRHARNRSWGIDLDQPTLDWGMEHRVDLLGDAAERVILVQGDVREVRLPRVDLQVAFNFSFFTFTERSELRRYFRTVRRSLAKDGIFFLDLFGGSESTCVLEEKTRYRASVDPDGTRIPAFTYIWEQTRFNPIDGSLTCHIHFKWKGGKRRRAFNYEWRLWTLPELRELLQEAGFARVDTYVEGWDDKADEPDGRFRRRRRFDNSGGWIAYLVALK